MDKQEELKTVTDIVKDILTKKPATRDDDLLLYAFYLNRKGFSKNIGYWDLRTKIKSKELSSIETIGRARRKIQEEYSELRSSAEIEEARRALEPTYEEYARNNY